MLCPQCEKPVTSFEMQEVMATNANDRLFGVAWICPECGKIINITLKPIDENDLVQKIINHLK